MKKLAAFLLIASLTNANPAFRSFLSSLKKNSDNVALAAGLLIISAINVYIIKDTRLIADEIKENTLIIDKLNAEFEKLAMISHQQDEQIRTLQQQKEQLEAAKNASWGRGGYFNRAAAYATKNPDK